MALNLTGQFTTGDNVNIGDGTNYAIVKWEPIPVNANPPTPQNTIIVAELSIWKGKASYNNGKVAIQGFGEEKTNEIKSHYQIDNAALLLAPQSNLNALPGKTIFDKTNYWIQQQVLAQILAANPTFTGTITDIPL